MGNLTSRGNGPRARTSGLCDNPATPSWSRPANGDSRFALSLSGEGRAFRLSLSTREAAAFAAMVAEHEGDALAAEYDARTARPSPLTFRNVDLESDLAALSAAAADAAAMLAVYIDGRQHNETRGQARAALRDLRRALAAISQPAAAAASSEGM